MKSLKKATFRTCETEDAFQQLKISMSFTPELGDTDLTKPFTIEIDACYGGLGAVLTQELSPLAY